MYKFEDIKHDDVKSFIMEFGYGSCHLLSQYIAKEMSKDIGIIKSDPSGMVIHSFIYLNDKYAFDAHGIDTIENTIQRYESFAAEYDEDQITVERHIPEEGVRELAFWCSFDDNDEDFMKSEFNHLDSLINIKEKLESVDKIDESKELKEQQSFVKKLNKPKL